MLIGSLWVNGRNKAGTQSDSIHLWKCRLKTSNLSGCKDSKFFFNNSHVRFRVNSLVR